MSQPSTPKPRARSQAAAPVSNAARQAGPLPPAGDRPSDPSDPPWTPDSIINAGDCRVHVSVNVYEHGPDGRLVALRAGDPRLHVHVDVNVHLHCHRRQS